MTLKEYVYILTKSVGEVKVSTSVVNELSSLTIEDKIISFDSKIIVSGSKMETVKYSAGDDKVTIKASVKAPKGCKWVGVFKIGLNEDEKIIVNLNIISVGNEIDVNDIMGDELKTLIKL